MSDMAKQARAAMKAKAQRLSSDRPTEKVDSSSWTPPEMLNADVKTGMRPVSRRAFKSGGKVEGVKSKANMGKSIRTGNKPVTPDSIINRNAKDANEGREGIKHIGGMKSGGRAKKMVGGPMAGAQQMMQRAQAVGDVPGATMGFAGIKKGSLSPARAVGLKKGGMAKGHEDVAADKALIKKMVKAEARTGKAGGGDFSVTGANTVTSKDAPMPPRRPKEFGPSHKTPADYDNSYTGRDTVTSDDDSAMPRNKGGRAKRKDGGKVFTGPGYPGKVPGADGGRTARASGGSTRGKGKTNINILIGGGKPADMGANPMGGPTPPPGMGGGMPGGMPIAVPPPTGGPGAGAPMPMPIPMPMPMPAPAGGPPMPRKSGGRTYRSYKDMDAGAGSGKGRLEKAEIQSRK